MRYDTEQIRSAINTACRRIQEAVEQPVTLSIPLPLPCDALVDQGRFCGEDPIGHKCYMPSAYAAPDDSILLCESCYELLGRDPERISFPPLTGRANAEQAIKNLLERMK